MSPPNESDPPLIVHLLPVETLRGAQIYAHALRDSLDGPTSRHQLMTIFKGKDADTADISLGVPPPRGPLRWFDPQASKTLKSALRSLQPAVVVAHGGEPLKYAALVRPPATKLVYLKIGTSRPLLRSPLRRLLYARIAARADAVVGVSSEMAVEAAELLGVSPDRLSYVPNGRDPVRFQPAAHGDHRPTRLCYVGHLDEGKRPQWFVELVRSLRQHGLDVVGVVAGGGPLAEQLALDAGKAEVELLGLRHDVPEILAASDVFIFPGTGRGDGMPGVLIEAGFAGLPTVTTDVPGARDVIEDGFTGFVVPVDDFDELVAATERLVLAPELRGEMGAAARERCMEHFTLEASAAKFAQQVLAPLLSSE